MIPFSPPRIDEETVKEVREALLSGWITTGPKTKQFEKELAEYCGNKKTLCVSSGTEGMELALKWFGVGEGDEVIIPVYTYCATAHAVLKCGAKPVMVDCNKRDFNMDVFQLKEKITENTKVILPVDVGGYPCDYDEIYKLINNSAIKNKFTSSNENQEQLGRIMVLSDAAHSLGGEYKGKMCG
ncbi:MAG: DegT/DnrJ/EryC1/StrS family aminotransferase, partial [Flavobacteriales bacterium]